MTPLPPHWRRLTRALLLLLVWAAPAAAQDPQQVQRLFQAGQHQQVLDMTGLYAPPAAMYLAGQSAERIAPDRAARYYTSTAAYPEDDAWRYVGLSAIQLLQGDEEAALASARRAVAMDATFAEAHYQLGRVFARREAWTDASDAFERAATLDPGLAYASYFGGLAAERAGRPDRMIARFEQFLRAAPEAPERPDVQQALQAVRGR